MILHEKMKERENALFLECIKISTKVFEIYLLVTEGVVSPDRISNLVLSCSKNLSFAKTVYKTVQNNRLGNEYEDFLNDLVWNDFLISLAMVNFLSISQERFRT